MSTVTSIFNREERKIVADLLPLRAIIDSKKFPKAHALITAVINHFPNINDIKVNPTDEQQKFTSEEIACGILEVFEHIDITKPWGATISSKLIRACLELDDTCPEYLCNLALLLDNEDREKNIDEIIRLLTRALLDEIADKAIYKHTIKNAIDHLREVESTQIQIQKQDLAFLSALSNDEPTVS